MISHGTLALQGALRRWGPFLVPPLYLVFVFCLQPADHLGEPDVAPWLNRLFYDDCDMAAMAQRGLNAQLGRLAGGTPPELVTEPDFRRRLDRHPPLAPRYFLEYPHAAVLLFRLGFLGEPPPEPLPAAVLDGDQYNVVTHLPRPGREKQLWQRLRVAIRTYELGMIACLLLLMAVLRAGYEPGGHLSASAVWLVLPATLYFTLNRYDMVPVLLVALSLACAGRRQLAASALFLALATATKVYPVLLAPLLCRYWSANLRHALLWAAVYGTTLAVCVGMPFVFSDPTAALAPYVYQLTRAPEPGWTAYGHLFPEAWQAHGLYRLGSLALLGSLLVATRPADLASLLRRSALLLILFVTLPVFWSPQWILWLLPLLLPLAARTRSLIGLIIALDVVTFLSFPIIWDSDERIWGWARITLLYTRFALLAALAAILTMSEAKGLRLGRWFTRPRSGSLASLP